MEHSPEHSPAEWLLPHTACPGPSCLKQLKKSPANPSKSIPCGASMTAGVSQSKSSIAADEKKSHDEADVSVRFSACPAFPWLELPSLQCCFLPMQTHVLHFNQCCSLAEDITMMVISAFGLFRCWLHMRM